MKVYERAFRDGMRVVGNPSQGVWRVKSPLSIRDVAVYRYRTGLWRCEADPGSRECDHICTVQETLNIAGLA